MIRLHFLIRFLGLTGLLLAAGGAIGAAAYLDHWTVANFENALAGASGKRLQVASVCLAAGGVAAIVALVLELLVGLKNAAGRRSALGGNVMVQIALALALLVGLNLWSFGHYVRWDVTRDRSFTLDKELARRLRELRGETTIVVYQQHKTFGRLSDKPDRYDSAAERKVVEKVKDLVDQLREFGPQFRVVVLDVEEEGFDRTLAAETARFPGLSAAIDAAPENSILFCDGTHVQRMNFNEFYQLDKTASKEADDKRGNLVLLSQGVEPFARRLLAIEEKRPRVGIAWIHELLSTRGAENEFSLAGVKNSLNANGFDLTDILLTRLG